MLQAPNSKHPTAKIGFHPELGSGYNMRKLTFLKPEN